MSDRDLALYGMTMLFNGAVDPLVSKITAWQNAQTTLTHVGGLDNTLFAGTMAVNAGATAICCDWGIIQDCVITRIVVSVHAADGITPWKFKIFRLNTGPSTFELVGEREFTPANSHSVQTFDITPISVKSSDIPGLWTPVGGQYHIGVYRSLAKSRNAAGDITATTNFTASSLTSLDLDCQAVGYPYLAITGDSIPEGHNVQPYCVHGIEHDIYAVTRMLPGGPLLSCEIAHQLSGLIGGGNVLKYQNRALGSQTFAWVASTGIVHAIATKATAILIHCGTNDIGAPRLWADVEADLDTIMAAVNAASPVPTLLIDEILPAQSRSDADSIVARTWNASLATWCATNGVTLVLCHDAMGQARVSTGELDDLKTAYNYDGVHLAQPGVNALAAIWKTYL